MDYKISLDQTGGMFDTAYHLEVALPAVGDAVARVSVADSQAPERRLQVSVARSRFTEAWAQLQALGAMSMPDYTECPATDLLVGRIQLSWPDGHHEFGGYGLGFEGPTAKVIDIIELLVGRTAIDELLEVRDAGMR